MKQFRVFWGPLNVFLLVVALTAFSNAYASPLLTYSLQNAEIGGINQKVLVPFVAEVPGGNVNVRVMGIVSQLNQIRPDLYQNIKVLVDPGFNQNGRITVETGILQGENLVHVMSELYYSFSALGMKELRLPAMGTNPVLGSSIPFPVAMLTVPGWKALPPANLRGVLVRVSEDMVLSAESFYQKLGARDVALANGIGEGLKSPNPRIRANVALNVGILALSDPTSKLMPLLKDVDREVRIAAVQAMDAFKSDPSVQSALEQVVDNDPESAVKASAVQVLVGAGRSEFQVFLYIEKLSDPNPLVVMDAVRKLADAKNPAASASLVDVLMHNSPDVREEAIAGLMRGKNGAGMQRGLQMTGVSDDVKLRLAKGMTGLDSPGYVDEGLSYILVAGSPAEASRAAEALGARKSAQGIPALVEGLNHPEEGVRVNAAVSLGQIGNPSGLEALADASRRGQGAGAKAAKGAAVTLLKSLSLDQVIDYSNNPSVVIRQLALESLSAFAQGGRNLKVVQELQNKLMDSDVSIRRAAAVSLSEIEDPGIARTFKAMIGDADSVVRSRVAVTLGWSKDGGAGMSLMELLKDSDSEVKFQAARSLARRQDRGALDELLKYVTYGKPEVRTAVLGAVVAVSSAADNERLMSVYQNALYDQEEAVKLFAVEGMSRNLGTPSAPSAISNLTSVIIDPSEAVQLAVVSQLGQSKDPMATEALARALMSDYRAVKLAALDAILSNGQENADKPLQEFIQNEQDAELLKKANSVYDQLDL